MLGSLVVGTTISSGLVLAQAEKLGETQYYLMNNLNMRKGPSTDNVIILTMPKRSQVKVIETSNDNKWAKVNRLYTSANVNFRTSASVNSSKICTIPKNSKLSILSYNSSKTWAQVKYNNKLGWVSANYLTSKITQDYKWGNTIARVNLRELPSLDGNKLLTMPSRASIKIYEQTNEWLKVSYNNTVGYCAAVYVK